MKKVGTREAQKHLTTLLKELPFAITRYGEVIAVVKSPDGEITEKDMKKGKDYIESCRHGYPAHLCTKCKNRG